MKKFTLFLLFCFFLVSPLYGGTFKLSGDRLEDLKLTFDSSGIDRSTPENTARGLLNVKTSVFNNPTFHIQLQKAEMNSRSALLKPIFTAQAFQVFFGRTEKEIGAMEKNKGLFKRTFAIKFEKTEKSPGGEVALSYKLSLSEQRPCRACGGNKIPKCRGCGGSGISKRDTTETGKIILLQKDNNWLVKAMLQKCAGCDGKGTCWRCKKPGRKCADCLGTAKCALCKGSGIRADSFLQGPGIHQSMGALKVPTVDTSTPQGLFETFGQSLNYLRNLRSTLDSKMREGFQPFLQFFVHPDYHSKKEKRPVIQLGFKVLKTEKDSDVSARVTYEQRQILPPKKKEDPKKITSHPISSLQPRTTRTMKLSLVKKDGKWLIDVIYEDCYGCGGQGKLYRYTCPDHPGRVYYNITTCRECGKGMKAEKGSEQKCYSCQGKGFMVKKYFFF